MADISKIKVGSTTYNIKDATLRDSILWQPPKLLWRISTTDGDGYDTVTWSKGVTKTSAKDSTYSSHDLALTPKYLFFGVRTTGLSIVQLGTWTRSLQDTSVGQGQSVSFSSAWDAYTQSYGIRTWCSIKRTATSTWTWTLTAGSYNILAPTGNTSATATKINYLWGIL